MMKRLLFLLAVAVLFASCETSEGMKYGTLQKVSHKTFPCDYYEIQVAYEGGVAVSAGESTSFQNTQAIKINKSAYDSLQQYLGERVVFDYYDDGLALCGSSKNLRTIKIKR